MEDTQIFKYIGATFVALALLLVLALGGCAATKSYSRGCLCVDSNPSAMANAR